MSEDYIDVQEILEGAHPDESAAYLFERIKVAVPAIANLRAQRDAARAGQWQPIETAPKDGTHILGFDSGEAQIITWDNYDNSWMVYPQLMFDVTPTHWQPLPPTPATAGEAR